GGRMIIPVGSGIDQQLFLLEKKEGQMAERAILPVRFVPMAGEAAKK
ncbi:MAG: protein-L-isoaspartate(D-aspartate) O-methyltransferase, partial [Verrucomicrobia bacterium]